MAEEINHRYLKDKNGDVYFPVTHIDAVIGGSKESTEESITEINSKINQLTTSLDQANKTIKKQQEAINFMDVAIGDMVGDTGWKDISVPPPASKNTANTSGFKSGIREVRVGNNLIPHWFIVRSIRVNISNITGSSMLIAQLPTGFITDNQSFVARQHGSRHPVFIECKKDGSVTALVHPDDQEKTNWVYQEFTWLE